MNEAHLKHRLHEDLWDVRHAILATVDGVSEYDIRRPLTDTGTNLLGLVKHLSVWDSRYFGLVFDRPCPEPIPRWDDATRRGTDLWATEHETRGEIVDRARRVWSHADAVVAELPLDAPGHVPWWPHPDVTLFDIVVHVIVETSRHAGHADVLREQLDGATGWPRPTVPDAEQARARAEHRAVVERAARECSEVR